MTTVFPILPINYANSWKNCDSKASFLPVASKNFAKHLAHSKITRTFASLLRNKAPGAVAQLNRAFDYGSEGLGFESLQRHKKMLLIFR